MNVINLARFLGWLSVGRGVLQFLGNRRMANGLGMTGRAGLFRALAVREIGTGVAILANPTSAPLFWARVGGNAIDIATLAGTPAYGASERARVKMAIAGILGAAVVGALCATRLGTESDAELRGMPPYWD